MNDSSYKNHHELMVTDKCVTTFNANIEETRTKDRYRKTIFRQKRTINQIADDKLKDRLRKRKEKFQRTDAENEIHRIKNRVAVAKCRERECSIVCRPEDVLLKHLQRCAYLNARPNDKKIISKEKAQISQKLWRSTQNDDAQKRYNKKERERKSNVRCTKRHQKMFTIFNGNKIHEAESYTTAMFVPRFECRFESKTTCFRDVLNINEHSDVIKHLCLIPLKFVPATPILICYWPCLVFRGVNKAMLSHQKIYPLQHNIQLKLQKKLMQRSLANGNIDDDRFVVLPLSSSHGCFPKTMSTNVLYDVVDHNSLQSHQYWKTVIPKNANQFQGGKNVYRLLENFEVVRAYVREAMTIMSPTSVLGNDLIDTLLEMKRLCRLEIEI